MVYEEESSLAPALHVGQQSCPCSPRYTGPAWQAVLAAISLRELFHLCLASQRPSEEDLFSLSAESPPVRLPLRSGLRAPGSHVIRETTGSTFEAVQSLPPTRSFRIHVWFYLRVSLQ